MKGRFDGKLQDLSHTDFDYTKTSISDQEGEFIWNTIRENQYSKTLEIGCALGISSLYICDAASVFQGAEHTIIDPYQNSQWKLNGVQNLKINGHKQFMLVEEPSEIALPKLLERKEQYDFGFIDGWHTFDHTLLDFFYLNRLIRVGGTIIIDDVNWASISRVVDYINNYPCYHLVIPEASRPPGPKHRSARRTIFKLIGMLSKVIPIKDRTRIFSQAILREAYSTSSYPSMVGLFKHAEDERDYNWYVPF